LALFGLKIKAFKYAIAQKLNGSSHYILGI